MARSRLVAIALSVAIAIAPAPSNAGIIFVPPVLQPSGTGAGVYALAGCVAGIIFAAIDASRRFNRELTPAEAASCGLLYWINLANLRP